MSFSLNEQGFVLNYLISGRTETDFSSDKLDKNQLRYEKMLRTIVADHDREMPAGEIALGKDSALGHPWEYYYSYGNWFVDSSTFYPLLQKVEFHAATILCAEEDVDAEIWLWSFAAIDLWVNGQYQGGIEQPVYKPIQRKVMKLSLKKGENLLYIRLQNLGVRDTRSQFAIQVTGEALGKLTVSLPDLEHVKPYMEADQWLSGVSLSGAVLTFPTEAPQGTTLIYDSRTVDFTKYDTRFTYVDVSGLKSVELMEDKPFFQLSVAVEGQALTRDLERQEAHHVVYGPESDFERNKERVFKSIAETGQIARGKNASFSMYPILARYYCNQVGPDDEKEIYKSLNQIESRMDCSDFLACAMVRFVNLYPMDEKMEARYKEVMLNYRYWMDENGADGMCFWSENHSLMFYVSAYLTGERYPEDVFVRSGKTGAEVKALAGKRIRQWLSDVCAMGFDEFHSGGYTPITFAAILNVVDFGEADMSEMAVKAADRLLKDLAVQTFKGVSISPQGRVYREVLYPFEQDIQCLINLMDPQAPDRFSEWVIFLATSKYKIPVEYKEWMDATLSLTYHESNALVAVEKQKDYMLTSVQSPRLDGVAREWRNISKDEDADTSGFPYVKSLNECFHGTTQFEPGVFGYQQHMWYAALDADTNIFVNHPGGSYDGCSVRPGYWFGNGIMPALKQVKEVLYAVYQIPETHPIPFTHLYWPGNRFEEQKTEDGWMAGKKNNGYVAIWCSQELKPYNDQLFGCEYRANARKAAYVCVCGSGDEFAGLDEFLQHCKDMRPEYNPEFGVLKTAEETLEFVACCNETQYI